MSMDFDEVLKNTRYARWVSQGRFANRGKIFFVDLNGDDNNPGNKPECAMQTIDTALGSCTNDYDDYIFVLDAWSADTEPIIVDKEKVHIIGVNNPQAPWICLQPGTDVNTIELTSDGNHCEIAGLNLSGGTNNACIAATSGAIGVWIHYCAFGHPYAGGTPKYGIYANNDNMAAALIEDNWFFGSGNNSGGVITDDGIYQTGTYPMFKNSIIRRNILIGIPGVAINLDNVQGAMVLSNKIALDANTAGAGITLQDGCLGCFVDDNSANYGDTAMGNNPYSDGCAAGANTWGVNYKAGTSIMPA